MKFKITEKVFYDLIYYDNRTGKPKLKPEYSPEDWRINDYIVHSDGSISVFDGPVDLSLSNIEYLPYKFRYVKGGFDCSGNYLRSLRGSPEYVDGNFICSDNYLSGLTSSPRYVNGDFDCTSNALRSLDGLPDFITGDLECTYNQLDSVELLHRKVGGKINCNNNEGLEDDRFAKYFYFYTR